MNENIINQSVYSLSSIESHKNYDSNLVNINTNSDNQLICSSSIQSKVSNNFYNASELKINSNSKINISDVNSVEDQELDNYIKNWPLVSNPDILSKYFNNLYKSVTSDNEMFGGSLFKITKNTKKHLKKFNCWEHTIELATTDTKLDNFLTAGDIYFDLFTQVFQQFIEPLNSKSKIRVLIFHDDFQVPINLSFMDKKDLTVQLLFDAIDKTVQSKKKDPNFEIQTDKKLKISIIIADNPSGSGRSKKSTLPGKRKMLQTSNEDEQYKKIDKQTVINEYCTKLNSVYKIKNNDNLCLLRSYIIGKATNDKIVI